MTPKDQFRYSVLSAIHDEALSISDAIDQAFHLKVSRHERDLYEEFCNSVEAELLKEVRDYFIEAKQKSPRDQF
jgi:hypothetical protein